VTRVYGLEGGSRSSMTFGSGVIAAAAFVP